MKRCGVIYVALEIKPTKAYKTDLKKYKNNEKVASRLKIAIDLLINGNPLPTDYRDHIYVGGYRKYKNVRDCHILPDCVLLYTKTSDSLILIRLGNHGSIVESLKKLRKSEDTTCIPSKVSYEDFDLGKVHYFGKQPEKPKSWRDVQGKKKKTKEMKEDKENTHYFYVMAWDDKEKLNAPCNKKRFDIYEDAVEYYNQCYREYMPEGFIRLFEFIGGRRKLIATSEEGKL